MPDPAPRPWSFTREARDPGWFLLARDANGRAIFRHNSFRPTSASDVETFKLAVRAPKMLEALERIRDMAYGNNPMSATHDTLAAIHIIAAEAINDATPDA